ncbi:MAG: hypothetical protein RJB38_1844 [Pseudomonadota bacterium]|jgi:hypothetical protein
MTVAAILNEPQYVVPQYSGFPTTWDYFTRPEGNKGGYLRDMTSQMFTLCTNQGIDERRWIRLLISHPSKPMALVLRGRIVSSTPSIDCWPNEQLTLFRSQVQLFEELSPLWLDALHNLSLCACRCGSIMEKRKPAAHQALADEVCGLCYLKRSIFTSRL